MQSAKTEAQTSVSFFPNPFPALWASEWGEDEFGLWMALTFQGIRQVFRWILPGAFLMGSPEDEPERLDWETQHQVILTQGY
jgi:formylglycine-generating enzyme